MTQNNVLDQKELSFFMTLGSYDGSDIEGGNQYFLPVSNTSSNRKRNCIVFFISKALPETLIVNDGVNHINTPSDFIKIAFPDRTNQKYFKSGFQ